jgi:murein DD-endopeptidase MepM/ murein hydrolase activator NlpD
MQNKSTDQPDARPRGTGETESTTETTEQPGALARSLQSLLQMGLGELLIRAATNVFSLAAIIVVVWLAQAYFRQPASAQANAPSVPTALPPAMSSAAGALPIDLSSVGIQRQADLHTNVPERARQEIVKYTVQKGDTVSGIADKYGLQPKTVFAANYELLQDNPEALQPGQELRILPVDGVYWEWMGGIPFGQWAEYFKVKPEDIINYPANHLDVNAVGDPQNANIKTGTFLIVPNGEYQYHTPGQLPLGITRTNPASAQVGGAGACPAVTGGAIGYGTFVYPTDRHDLSGFDYSTKTNHLGIDLSGNMGDNVYAADGGVVVYAGTNSYGYGNMIMVDHGTGFQTLYAHLSAIFVQCGYNVTQGQTIGSIGSTGHSSGAHLHFEVRTASAVISPWDVLPAP